MGAKSVYAEVDCRPSKGKSKVKCCREGKITRNPFFNFLRQYRKEHCGCTVVQIAVGGAKVWNCMDKEEKREFVQLAEKAPKLKQRSKRGKGRRVKQGKGQRLC